MNQGKKEERGKKTHVQFPEKEKDLYKRKDKKRKKGKKFDTYPYPRRKNESFRKKEKRAAFNQKGKEKIGLKKRAASPLI